MQFQALIIIAQSYSNIDFSVTFMPEFTTLYIGLKVILYLYYHRHLQRYNGVAGVMRY